MGLYPAQFNKVINTVQDIDPPSSEELACDWGNPQACRDDNTQRAEFAGVAVKAYADRTFSGGQGEEPATIIGDLLGDLMHLCDALGLDFAELEDSGRRHYLPELAGTF